VVYDLEGMGVAYF